MYVQNVLRPNLDFRGFSGVVNSGVLGLNDKVIVGTSSESAKITSITTGNHDLKKCSEGDSVTITLDKEIDISRGDLLTTDSSYLEKGKMFNANLIWLNDERCYKNQNLLLKIGTKIVNASISNFKHKIDINNYSKIPCKSIDMNEIANCELKLDQDIEFKSYDEIRALGSFILIDKFTNLTVAAGTINHSLRRTANINWEKHDVEMADRNKLLGHKSKIIWFTGLSGSGKSTLTNLLEKKLHAKNILTYTLDGDNLRHGLNSDLGFTSEDRIENLRRVGELSKVLYDSGIFVLASFISPFKTDRKNIREMFPDNDFIEVYVHCDIEVLKNRDPKGLYKKALEGEIPNFTGINSPYEVPENPEIIVDTNVQTIEDSVQNILEYMKKNDVF